VNVTEMRALQQLTVWACVALVSDVMASLPVDVVQSVGSARRRLETLPPLLRRPHPEQSWPEWLGRQMVALLLRGNAYGLVQVRDRRGFPTQIFPLHPDEVSVRRVNGAIIYKVRGVGDLTSDQVLHVKGMARPGLYELTGLSPIEYARQGIGLALGAEEYGARYFGESATPPSILTTDASLDQEEVDLLEARWTKAHAERQRRPAILSGGIKYEQIAISPEEAQFLETRRYSRSEIAGFYRVPPHMIGDVERSTSWGSGIEEQNLLFAQVTLGIWLTRWETALSAMLPRGLEVKFNVGALLRARLLDRYQAHLMSRQGGWHNADEIRALEDEAPLPDGKGQDYLQPLNYAPVPVAQQTQGGPPV
jgi:HK97 family phage portal protein